MGFLSDAVDVAQFVAPYAAGFATSAGQASANRANIRLAREQMAFQERMSGSAYQRASQDMQLAGINPMLGYMQGGASSPSGALTSVEDTIGPGVASAQGAMRLKADMKRLFWDIEAQKIGMNARAREGQLAFQRIDESAQAISESKSRAAVNEAQRRLLTAGLPRAQLEGGKINAVLDTIRRTLVGPGGGAVNLIPRKGTYK